MKSVGRRGLPAHLVAHVSSRYAGGVIACAAATVVPLASAANVRMQAGPHMTAADIYCNIMRGARIQDYFASGQTFTIPVLWLCSLLVISIGAMLLFVPAHLDIERTRLLTSRSRTAYWLHRAVAIACYMAVQLAWRLVCCALIAWAIGGTPTFDALSKDASGLFQMEGSLVWSAGELLRANCMEFAALYAMSLVTGGIAVVTSLPAGVAALVGYVTVSIFTCLPVLIPNELMLHRMAEHGVTGGSAMWFALGMTPLLAAWCLLFLKLRSIDFLR